MALTAADFSNLEVAYLGPNLKVVTGKWTGPASYASGGEALTQTIAARGIGLKQIFSLTFTPLVDENNAALGVQVVFDHNLSGTTIGKIRCLSSGLTAHTHNLSVIGGQGAAGTDAVTAPAATDLLGKQEAGDALVLGADVATKGGVVAAAVVEATSEVAAATALNGYVSRFIAFGV